VRLICWDLTKSGMLLFIRDLVTLDLRRAGVLLYIRGLFDLLLIWCVHN
jgi:hypothetical protein